MVEVASRQTGKSKVRLCYASRVAAMHRVSGGAVRLTRHPVDRTSISVFSCAIFLLFLFSFRAQSHGRRTSLDPLCRGSSLGLAGTSAEGSVLGGQGDEWLGERGRADVQVGEGDDSNPTDRVEQEAPFAHVLGYSCALSHHQRWGRLLAVSLAVPLAVRRDGGVF
jgi:hypothetical protein